MMDTPRPLDSRAYRIAQFKKTVDKVAPPIDQTQILSPEEVERLKTETSRRQEDHRCAAREGRSGSLKRFHGAVERVTGNTPPDGHPTRPRSPSASGIAHIEDDDPLEGTDEPEDDDGDEG